MDSRRPGRSVILASAAAVVLLAATLGIPGRAASAGPHGDGAVRAGVDPAETLPAACGPGGAWVAGWGGLACLDADGWAGYQGGYSEFPGGAVQDVAVCAGGTSWLVTTSGLVSTDGTAWQSHQMPTYASLAAVACDGAGGAWLAAYGGVHHFDGASFTTYPSSKLGTGSFVDLVKDIAVGPDGHVWVTTTNSVATFDGASWRYFQKGKGFKAEYWFDRIAVDAKGRVWATASPVGLVMYDGSAWKAVAKAPTSTATAVAIDKRGRVWVGTYSGLSMYDGRRWVAYKHAKSGLPTDSIRALATDARGRVWVGTGWGLAILDGKTWTAYHMADSGILDDEIRAIGVDAKGPTLPALDPKEPGKLTGRIVRGDKAQAGIPVELCNGSLASLYSGASPCASRSVFLKAKTDTSGRFTFARVPVGRYSLTFRPSGGKWTMLAGITGMTSDEQLVRPGETTDVGTLDLAKSD